MAKNFENVEISGGRLTITRDALMLKLETCIGMQEDCKASNDFTNWLLAAGYIEALKDLLSHFEG